MTKFVHKVKMAWLKGVEAVGTTASNLASNAKFKVAEINLETRRREVMSEFTQKAYEMWQNGTALPDPLGGMLQQASDLDEELSVLRAQKYAAVEQNAAKQAPVEGESKTQEPAPETEGFQGQLEDAAKPEQFEQVGQGNPPEGQEPNTEL